MYTKTDKEKIQKICQMILEVASGNFSYRIERSRHQDQLETIIVLLNMMAEEIRESFHHFALVNPHETYKHIAQMTFILDGEFRIRNFNAAAEKILNVPKEDIRNHHFEEFLSEDSREQWQKEALLISKDTEKEYFHTLRLFFSARNSLTVPSLCSISSLRLNKDGEKLFFVTALQTIVQSQKKEKEVQDALLKLRKSDKSVTRSRQNLLHRQEDKKKIQAVYDYILNNLDKPLPNLRKLANDHGTNEYKLKLGFNQLYNTNVFLFQREQRLKRAHSFILESELPLYKIARICGFKSQPHFSKLFKKKYHYNPSELRRSKKETV